jgi:hypothetical protein
VRRSCGVSERNADDVMEWIMLLVEKHNREFALK